jgi:hypothetical protein
VLRCEFKEKGYVPDYLKDGAIIDGLFLEGCIIDDQGMLVEAANK